MKQYITSLFILLGVAGYSQNILDLVSAEVSTDTLRISEAQVVSLENNATGSMLTYFDGKGTRRNKSILERGGADTAAVSASITVVFTGTAGRIDTVYVNDVAITTTQVAYNTSITQTVSDLADSITAQTTSPDYTATASDSTLTILSPTTSAETYNGYTATVDDTSITHTFGSVDSTLAGGFNVRRNVLSMGTYLFVTNSVTLNAARVLELLENGSGSIIWYNDPKKRVYTTTDPIYTLEALIDAR